MIGIIDYGLGNFFSVFKALARLGIETKIISNPESVYKCTKLILPGVGHFGSAMEKLKHGGWIQVLNQAVIEQKTPILGICLGMQLMTMKSEEGGEDGLGWFKAKTVKFSALNLRIPHIGWNTVDTKLNEPLFFGIDKISEFYFVHSFYVVLDDVTEQIGTTEYGKNFTSAIQKDNIWAVQFHPEKSYVAGLQLLKNFVQIKS